MRWASYDDGVARGRGRCFGQFGFGQYESDRAGVRRPRDDAMAGRGSRRRRLRGGAVRLRPRRDFRRVAGDQGGLFAQPLDGPGGDELGHAGRPGGLARRRRAQRWDRPQAHAAACWRAVHFRSCLAVVGVRRGDPCRGPIHRWHRRRRGRRRGAALCGRIGAGEPARPFHLQLSAGDHSRHLPGLSGQRPTRRRRAVG